MKKVFITGATSGIGLALAKKYSTEGWFVGICGRDLTKLPENFIDENPFIKAYEADVTNREQLQTVVREFSDGKLDLMIANAGRSVGTKTAKPNFQVACDLLDVNVKGVIHSFEVAFEIMEPNGGGHLAAVASVAGMVGLPGAGPYSCSKAAVIKLCESYQLDLPRYGINITTICPGFIDTPLTKKNGHGMPFLMSADEGARRIKKGIDKKINLLIFPLPMRVGIYLLDRMPRCLYRFLMRNIKSINYSN